MPRFVFIVSVEMIGVFFCFCIYSYKTFWYHITYLFGSPTYLRKLITGSDNAVLNIEYLLSMLLSELSLCASCLVNFFRRLQIKLAKN